MQTLKDKVAFITGGASGLGLAMAESFGRAGAKVMLADIEQQALAAALEGLRAKQIRAEGVLCDVTSRNAVKDAALKTIAAFGKVHLVCNNAGVGAGGAIGGIEEKSWDWVIDVNLKGVVYGVETFVPLILSHGEGGHIVNTASMAGMISPPGMEPYCATKFAVVAMSEGWAAQLQPQGIGVSVLCPGFVRTRIHESARNRQSQYGGAAGDANLLGQGAQMAAEMVHSGIDPVAVGNRVLEAVQAGELYIFTHPELKGVTQERFGRILAAFDVAEASPALKGQPRRDPLAAANFAVTPPK